MRFRPSCARYSSSDEPYARARTVFDRMASVRAAPLTLPSPPLRGERVEKVYEPGRLVTELTGWIGDRSELSAGGGPADAVERDLSDGRTDAVYRSGFGGRG